MYDKIEFFCKHFFALIKIVHNFNVKLRTRKTFQNSKFLILDPIR